MLFSKLKLLYAKHTADAIKAERFLFDLVIVVAGLTLRALTILKHLSFLLPFKFRLIEYYMVNIASSADLS